MEFRAGLEGQKEVIAGGKEGELAPEYDGVVFISEYSNEEEAG